MKPKRIRIGELLVSHGVLAREQVETALASQKATGRKLGQTLVELGFISEDALLHFLAEQLQLPFVELRKATLSKEAVQSLREIHARRYRALVLQHDKRDALVAMADPTDVYAADEIARILGKPVRVAIVRESELIATIDRVYRKTEEISELASELHEELGDSDFSFGGNLEDGGEDAPVTKLLQSLFEDAVRAGASDVHIEPDEKVLRIRERIDGHLHEQLLDGTRVASALVLRLKLMAGLDIAEKRLPQDGRFHVRLAQREIDVRISTMPTAWGESVVMRLLDQSGGALGLDKMGMPPDLLARIQHLIHLTHGLLLVTGPTGSGKTTTLYAALRELNVPECKIITVEDPVEYRLPRIQQVQVHAKIQLTFASVLRAVLRQDPDIVMVGEMRDGETAQIGLRAALTGHLVLSTLHTNDAVASAIRLADMGVDGYLVASALRGVLAQRLLRRLCEHCREVSKPSIGERAWLAAQGPGPHQDATYHRGAGCSECRGTGYRGRAGVYELFEPDAPSADALRRGDHTAFERCARASAGYRPLSAAALDLARAGTTSLAEVLKVAEAGEGGAAPAASPAAPASGR